VKGTTGGEKVWLLKLCLFDLLWMCRTTGC